MIPGKPETELKKYLEGKLFISTRPESRSQELEALFTAAGASLVELPMIGIKPVSLSAESRKNLRQTSTFDWIVFTSENGVRRFMDEYERENGSRVLPGGTNLATIGDKTAEVLSLYGHSPEFVSDSSNASGFADELVPHLIRKHARVLWPTGSLSPGILVKKLNGICDIRRMDLYETIMPDDINQTVLDQVIRGSYDIIFFFSPSAVRNFRSVAGNRLDITTLRAACIGPVTRDACLEAGIRPLFMPGKPCSAALFEATVDHYRKNKNKKEQYGLS